MTARAKNVTLERKMARSQIKTTGHRPLNPVRLESRSTRVI